ncbi:PREDICTED: uncharacterized protein LOC18609682 [Theobroma cacao]|uniref:Uncharacterized protein LOC18609682 n=1 Tax=Theobroma cacao TaxID=3641 RepID=A0AB32VW97_THECC|nr:PREDICTED: uncharacterized protein LOC18609682 [Theobroma cacao]
MVRDAMRPEVAFNHGFENELSFVEKDPNPNVSSFYSLLSNAEEPLCVGCTKHTTLSTVSQLLNVKAEYNLSESCFDLLLKIIKNMLPSDENLPIDFYRMKKKVCGHPRYKQRNSSVRRQKKIPYKILRYLPLIPRLQRLYMSCKTAEHMTCHAQHHRDDGLLRHPVDGEAWQHFNCTHEFFAMEPRNVRLGLCADGFNPFGSTAKPYSIWPVMLCVYNLPPWIRMKQRYIFLNMVIPGKKSPSQNIDVFLRPLIKELTLLWRQGVVTYDAYRKQNFHMRAALLWTINDFSAYDVMHIGRNFFENILNTMIDVKGRTKDNIKARQDLKVYCKRPKLELVENNRKLYKPKAVYTLNKEEIRNVCAWVKQLRLPNGFASNISRDLCVTEICIDHMETLQGKICETICKLEKIFPPGFFDLMEHLSIHLPYEVKVGGPVQYRWMHPFERFLQQLKKKVKNRAFVEGSIYEAYVIEEVSSFCSCHGYYDRIFDEIVKGDVVEISKEELEKVAKHNEEIDQHIIEISYGPRRMITCYSGYFVNGFKFHTLDYGQNRKIMNSGVCIKGSFYNDHERDFYGILVDIIKLEYFGVGNRVVLFKCHWFDTEKGIKVDRLHGLVDVNYNSILARVYQEDVSNSITSTQSEEVDLTELVSGDYEEVNLSIEDEEDDIDKDEDEEYDMEGEDNENDDEDEDEYDYEEEDEDKDEDEDHVEHDDCETYNDDSDNNA